MCKKVYFKTDWTFRKQAITVPDACQEMTQFSEDLEYTTLSNNNSQMAQSCGVDVKNVNLYLSCLALNPNAAIYCETLAKLFNFFDLISKM